MRDCAFAGKVEKRTHEPRSGMQQFEGFAGKLLLFYGQFSDFIEQRLVTHIEHRRSLLPIPLGLLKGSQDDFFLG